MEDHKSYFPENREQIEEFVRIYLETIIPQYHRLSQIESPTPEELEIKKKLIDTIKKSGPVIEFLLNGVLNHQFKYLQDMMVDARIKGERGDEQALHLYLKLKDSYQAALKEGLNEN